MRMYAPALACVRRRFEFCRVGEVAVGTAPQLIRPNAWRSYGLELLGDLFHISPNLWIKLVFFFNCPPGAKPNCVSDPPRLVFPFRYPLLGEAWCWKAPFPWFLKESGVLLVTAQLTGGSTDELMLTMLVPCVLGDRGIFPVPALSGAELSSVVSLHRCLWAQ